ncbi:MAG: alpha/beta fold hydrolase [Acidimicrobiales bacterium]
MSGTEPELHYELAGPEGGTPVVFTHGFLNTGDIWSEVVDELDGSVRSLTWDLRAHGRSQAPAPGLYSRDHALADLGRMLDVAGRPAILVGHSLGGYLSLAHTILSPDDVAGLVLVAAGPGFRSPDSREQWNDSVRIMTAQARGRGDDLAEGMEEISMHVDSMVMDRLTEITAPVYTVVGERDQQFQASAAVFDKNLDVKRRVQVPDAGHMVQVKHPAPVAEAIRYMVDLASGSGS